MVAPARPDSVCGGPPARAVPTATQFESLTSHRPGWEEEFKLFDHFVPVKSLTDLPLQVLKLVHVKDSRER